MFASPPLTQQAPSLTYLRELRTQHTCSAVHFGTLHCSNSDQQRTCVVLRHVVSSMHDISRGLHAQHAAQLRADSIPGPPLNIPDHAVSNSIFFCVALKIGTIQICCI
jgi:hypothetical protein